MQNIRVRAEPVAKLPPIEIKYFKLHTRFLIRLT